MSSDDSPVFLPAYLDDASEVAKSLHVLQHLAEGGDCRQVQKQQLALRSTLQDPVLDRSTCRRTDLPKPQARHQCIVIAKSRSSRRRHRREDAQGYPILHWNGADTTFWVGSDLNSRNVWAWQEPCGALKTGNTFATWQVLQGVSKTVTNLSAPRPTWPKRNTATRVAVSGLLLIWLVASVFVHPLPHDASDRAGAPLLQGADVPPSVVGVFSQACVNCHSDETRWPWYSLVAPGSWLVENDVKRARERLNLSHWDSLEAVEQRSLLTAIATVIENREMPLHKYVVFHEDAKLSAEESLQVIEWTRAERRRLRTSAPSLTK